MKLSAPITSILALAALVPLLGLGGCNHQIDTQIFDLELFVDVTGDATVSQVVYSGGSVMTPITINTPALPFTVQLEAVSGNTVTLQVTGTANNGVLTATIADDPFVVPAPVTYATQTCGPTVPTCNLNVQNVF